MLSGMESHAVYEISSKVDCTEDGPMGGKLDEDIGIHTVPWELHVNLLQSQEALRTFG